MVEPPRRVLSREELLKAGWGEVSVTDESLSKCIAEARKALADDSQEIIRTVPRRGFLFDVEVRRVEQPPAIRGPSRASRLRMSVLAGLSIAALAGVALAMKWRTAPAYKALAVLPFESLSSGGDQQYLADGMTEALITNLGRASPLRVIARTSVNRYLKSHKAVQEIARELNVDLLLEGTIAQSRERLRVTANLIQVSPEKHIWAHAYDGDLRDVLALQDEIASAI